MFLEILFDNGKATNEITADQRQKRKNDLKLLKEEIKDFAASNYDSEQHSELLKLVSYP